jgi:hypothetical protein
MIMDTLKDILLLILSAYIGAVFAQYSEAAKRRRDFRDAVFALRERLRRVDRDIVGVLPEFDEELNALALKIREEIPVWRREEFSSALANFAELAPRGSPTDQQLMLDIASSRVRLRADALSALDHIASCTRLL